MCTCKLTHMWTEYIGCIILYRREGSIGLIVTYVIHVQIGCTAFFIACQEGQVAVVQLLLQKHADVSMFSKAIYLLYMSLHNTKFKFTCLSGLVAVHYLTPLDSTQPAELPHDQ